MFDTHCHLNFKAFDGKVKELIEDAKAAGVSYIVVPGTDLETSKRAVEIANSPSVIPSEVEGSIFAAVGIHPHHVYEFRIKNLELRMKEYVKEIESLLKNKKVVAIGEVGVDRHYYNRTKYQEYKIDETFIELQKELLKDQIKLAIKYNLSLILHNRKAKKDMLHVLNDVWDGKLEGRSVFHCCEPDEELLEFAKQHKIYLGVDGDVTYRKDKQEFIKKVPLEMLVLETDSPFLLPEPLRSYKKFPNKPENLKIIAECIAKLKALPLQGFMDTVSENSMRLFNISL